MTATEVFDYYRTSEPLTLADTNNFTQFVEDKNHPTRGCMAVSGLTVSLLENAFNEDKFRLLLTASVGDLPVDVEDRALVGVMLAMIVHDKSVRISSDLLDDVVDVITYDADVSLETLCAIARTTQVERIEKCNQQLTTEILPFLQKRPSDLSNRQPDKFLDILKKHQEYIKRISTHHFDQNFVFFKDAYNIPFFRNSAANWFLPFDESVLNKLSDSDIDLFTTLAERLRICDSDKYAAVKMLKSLARFAEGMNFSEMLTQHEEESWGYLDTSGYVEQAYRFFRLSPFAKTSPFDAVKDLRDTLLYRLVVVGEEARGLITEYLA